MIKTAFLVSGGGTNLQAVIDANIFDEIPNCELTAVISSDPDAYAVTRAKSARIPVYIVEAGVFPNNASFCNALLGKLRDLDIDLVVMAGFNYKLEPLLVRHFKNRIIDVYPSLLPAFYIDQPAGIRPHEMALEYGVKISGASVYFVSETEEPGPVLLQQAVEVWEGDTPMTLQRRIMEEAEWKLLPKAIALFCSGRISIDGRKAGILAEEK